MGAAANTKVICVGDKSRAFMARYFPKNLIMVGSEIGRLPPQFGDAAAVANAILNSGVDYDQGKMVYNKYKSVVSYDTTAIPLFSQETVMGADKITAYDSVDADVVQSYLEFSLASLIYYAMKEGACSPELKDDCHGQLFQERRRNDRQTDDHLQQDSTGRHHWRADRDHFRRRRALSCYPPSNQMPRVWMFITFLWMEN